MLYSQSNCSVSLPLPNNSRVNRSLNLQLGEANSVLCIYLYCTTMCAHFYVQVNVVAINFCI